MPPRCSTSRARSSAGRASRATCARTAATFGFVDTLEGYGGPWSFDSEAIDLSNQYAAMPSLHIGWSTWCAVAVWPLLRRRWSGGHAAVPDATLFCIIVTGNHFWIDGVGGLLAFGFGTPAGGCTAGTRTASTASTSSAPRRRSPSVLTPIESGCATGAHQTTRRHATRMVNR